MGKDLDAPVVSVCMPAYNCQRYVAEAIESILGQTFRDFEFLIIDDGSTDGSLAILKRYAVATAHPADQPAKLGSACHAQGIGRPVAGRVHRPDGCR